MYRYDEKCHHHAVLSSILVALLFLTTCVSIWLAWRNSQPLRCTQPVAVDTVMYCEIPVQK